MGLLVKVADLSPVFKMRSDLDPGLRYCRIQFSKLGLIRVKPMTGSATLLYREIKKTPPQGEETEDAGGGGEDGSEADEEEDSEPGDQLSSDEHHSMQSIGTFLALLWY